MKDPVHVTLTKPGMQVHLWVPHTSPTSHAPGEGAGSKFWTEEFFFLHILTVATKVIHDSQTRLVMITIILILLSVLTHPSYYYFVTFVLILKTFLNIHELGGLKNIHVVCSRFDSKV